MLVFKLLFVSVCVLWTSEGISVPPRLQENLKKNEDNLPQATFPVMQQFYHTDEQIANVDALDLFKSLNPTIQIGTPDLLVSTTNQQKTKEASKIAQTTPIVKPTEQVKKPNEELTKFYEDFLKDIEQNRYVPHIYEKPTPVKHNIEATEAESDNSEKAASETKIQQRVFDNKLTKTELNKPELPQEHKPERRNKKSKRRKTKNPEDHAEETSYHESPGEIPTKPIYPGEGQWARKNLKHRPHISKHYDHPPKNHEDHQPEGKEVFDENRQVFNEEKAIHQRNLHDEPKELLPESDNVQTPEFVPYRNYAQVRKSETKKRIPKKKRKKNKKGKRLKESIKDSKVHTIYTEEGYEDNAYDHGEQEKNAKRKEIEKNKEEDTHKKHADDIQPITKVPNKETYEDIVPQPPAPPEYHEEQIEDGDGDESRTNENEDDKNEENQRDLKEENNEEQKGTVREEGTQEDNKQKKDDSVQRNDGDTFDVKIDEEKYPKDEKKVEENKEEKVEESQNDKKKKVYSTEKPKTTTKPPKRNIFDEDWFQKYKFDNIGDYYTDAFSTKNKKEEKQKPEESQQTPKEVKDDQIQEKSNSKEHGGDKKSKKIEDQDWFQKYRLDDWEEYLKDESKNQPQENSGKVEDNVKDRDQDKEYDVPKQEEEKSEEEPKEETPETESENSKKETENPETEEEEDQTDDNMSQTDEEIKIYVNYPKQQAQEETEDKLIDSMVGETNFGEKIKKNRRHRRSADDKFPYYKSEELDTASSLRYAENLNNIPVKKKGVVAFYDEADKTDCPETTEVDPVPDKIEATKDSNETKTNSTDKPRLEGRLGDQIDCMKSKYFGDNPLDNPLFSEEDVEVPTSIFKDEEEYEYYDDKDDDDSKRQPKSSERQVEKANSSDTSEALPKAEKYILRRKVVKKRRRYPYPRREYRPQYYRPTYQPSYQPSYNPEPSILMPYPSQPSQPQWSPPMVHVNEPSKQFSEVHYKEEIKPSEQLNVFTDIINNIKHSNGDSASQESSIEEIAIIRKPARNKYRDQYFVPTTTHKPFLPTPVQDKEEKTIRFKKRIPSGILPEHKDADEIIIVKKPPMLGNFKPYFPKEEDNFVPMVDHQSTKRKPPNYAQQPSNHVYQTPHHITPTRAPNVEEIAENGPLDNLEITTNNYYFLGMRPPPEFPYSHPNFYDVPDSTEKKKRRRNSRPKRRRRVKRSNNRRGYAEIRRGGRKEDGIEEKAEEEEDDYVPHRPKTFHYDEKTGKIVYDKKQEEPVEYDEVEYVEVEEATHPPKKKKEEKKRFPPTPPPGPSYLDFIKVLKTNPNYTVIEDPKPKEEKKKEEEAATTIRSIVTPTGIPEFLQILSKVKTDKTYEVILDPTPEPKKKKTTTPPPEEPDIEQSEEIQTEVQNSPGLQGILGFKSGLQVFDISEFVPKTRDYSPRTSIDTSKYTVIRRNHAKAEKAEEEEEEPQAEKVVMEQTTTQASRTIEIPTTSIRSTTPYKEEAPTTVQSKRVALRGRRRSTTTPSPTTKTHTSTTVRPVGRKRGRSRYRTTTQVPDAPLEETVRNRRNLHPRNHRREYAETRNDISNVLRVKPTPRSITLNIINQMDLKKLVNDTKPKEVTTVAPNEDVEVFQDYDKNKKHGGNYKYKKVVINTRITNYKPIDEEESGEKGTKETEDADKEYFKDPKLPEQINGLKEKKYELTETIFEEEDDGDNQDFFDDTTTEETSTRKLPNIIKDPSKRLYFYAPL